MYNCILCRYHEIATKGANRNHFEKQLVENIRHQLGPHDAMVRVLRVSGRVRLEKRDGSDFSDGELQTIGAALERTFGLESYSPALKVAVDMEALKTTLERHLSEIFAMAMGKVSFRIRARRSNKKFPLDSKGIELELAALVFDRVTAQELSVDLSDKADVTIGVEVRDEFSIIYFTSCRAPGGLPVGSNPPVLCLLSGGIDSPVAAAMTMQRGSAVHFLTFHSAPYTPPETLEKVSLIAKVLNSYQRKGILYACNLSEMQKAIRDNCSPRLRTVLYRRAMMRIAEKLAQKINCRALLTGEALGQVASQTLVNMDTINRAVEMLILRPLVGMDKNETIRRAERIGTFDISSWQVPDSCTVFAPTSPSTSVPLCLALHEEGRISTYGEIIDACFDNIEEVSIN